MTNYEEKGRQLKKLHQDSMLDSFYTLSCSCGACSCNNCNCDQQSSNVMTNNRRNSLSSIERGYFTKYTAMVTG